MSTSQSVFINIVVKGSGNIDTKNITGPLSATQKEITNINSSINATTAATARAAKKAAEDKLALTQYTANAENKLRDTQVININKMQMAQINASQRAANEAYSLMQYTAKQEDHLRSSQLAATERALRTEQAIRQRAANDALGITQYTAKQEDKLRNAQIIAAEKALRAEQVLRQRAANDSLGLLQYTAKQEDKLRTARIHEEERAARQAAAAVAKPSAFTNFIMREVNTLVKAVTSMIGIMLLFTAIVTIPELLIKGFIALTQAIITSADAAQQLQITFAALIASNMDFGKSATENFKAAQGWAKRVYLDFVLLSTESLATPKELGVAYQSFLAAGGAGMVKNLDEQVKLTGLLANAILTLTGRVQTERQLFTEMNALLEGQLRAGSQLSRFVKSQVGDLSSWITHIKASKNGLEEFTKVLAPFREAGEAQGKTFTGLITTIKGLVEALNLAATQNSALSYITDALTKVRDILRTTVKELTSVGGNLEALSPASRSIVNAFANISGIIEGVTVFLSKAVGLAIDLNNPAASVENITKKMVTYTAILVTQIQEIYDIIKNIIGPVKVILSTLWEIGGFIKMLIVSAGLLIATLYGSPEERLAALNIIKKDFMNSLRDIGNAAMDKPSDVFSERLKKNLSIIEDAIKRSQESLRQGFTPFIGPLPEAKIRPEQLEGQQLSAYQKLESELRIINSDGNAFIKIIEHQKEKAIQLENTFAKYPQHLASALSLHNQITKALITQEKIKEQRSIDVETQKLINQYDVLISRSDDLVKLQADYNEQVDALMLKYRHSYQADALAIQLDLLKKIYTQEKINIEQRIADEQHKAITDRYEAENNLILSITDQLKGLYNEAVGASISAVADVENKISLILEKITDDIMRVAPRVEGLFSQIKSRLDSTFSAMRSAAVFKDFITNSTIMVDKLRDSSSVLAMAKEDYLNYNGSLKQVRESLSSLSRTLKESEQLREFLQAGLNSGAFKGTAAKNIEKQIKDIDAAMRQGKKSIDEYSRVTLYLQDIMKRGEAALNSYATGSMKAITFLREALKNLAATMSNDVAGGITSMFNAFFQGQSVLKAFGGWIGQILVQLGQLCVTTGIAEMALAMTLSGRLMGASLERGLILLGVGIATIAAGAALGAAGSGSAGAKMNAGAGGDNNNTTPIYVNNNSIAAQQGIQQALIQNTQVMNSLNNEVSRLSKEDGNTLVSNAVRSNPSSVLTPLANKVRSSYEWQKKFGSAMVGVTV